MSTDLFRKAAETLRRQPVLGTREMSLAIADWLDMEATVLDSFEPWTKLLSLSIENQTGVKGYLRLMSDEDGNPQVVGDTTSAAERLARLIVGEPS